ncbi:MAG: hypothetical protein AVDCRST_MAG52-1366, partial [uncultured Blastococcus sp.]
AGRRPVPETRPVRDHDDAARPRPASPSTQACSPRREPRGGGHRRRERRRLRPV